MKKIKIGVLGCADIAKRMLVPNMIASKKFEIVAFASRNKKKSEEFSNLFGGIAVEGYENLLKIEELEAIYIPLPTGMHYEWIIKSLNSNKHVFSEKSIATDSREVMDILKLAGEKKLCVFENFMFPFHSQFEFVKEKLNASVIGDLRLLRSSFGFPMFKLGDNIRYNKALGGGALLDAGAYTLMASQLFLGKEQEVISAYLNNLDFEVDFIGAITLKNNNGIVSQLAFGFDNFYQNNIELWGSKGKIIIDRAFTAGPGFSPTVRIENQNESNIYNLSSDNHFVKILDKFYACIMEGNYDEQYNQILSQSKLITTSRDMNSLSKTK